LVRTCFPPIVVAFSIVPDALPVAAAAGAVLAGGDVVEELDEPPQAAMASTAAARPTAVAIFRIGTCLLTPCCLSHHR
jgi:hypothetical protein